MIVLFRAAGLAAAAILLAALAALGLPGSAQANGTESARADVLVEQAIGYLANGAEPAMVAERLNDALRAPQRDGVDLVKVRQALAMVERSGTNPDVPAVRDLLMAALGGKLPSADRTGTSGTVLATGAETGTAAVLDEFRPARGVATGGNAVLLALALAAIAGGLLLARKLRPPHRLRQLRARANIPAQPAAAGTETRR